MKLGHDDLRSLGISEDAIKRLDKSGLNVHQTPSGRLLIADTNHITLEYNVSTEDIENTLREAM